MSLLANFSEMLSEAQNCKYKVNILRRMNINNTCIFCCYFSTNFRSANPNFGLRPKLESD